MASQYHEVAYDSLLEKIGFESYQKLEEVLISGITSGIISGKMDQERKIFYVTSTIGRDVQLSGTKNLRLLKQTNFSLGCPKLFANKYKLDLSKMTEMTEAWATKTRGILVETVNMQKNEAAQEAKGNVLKP